MLPQCRVNVEDVDTALKQHLNVMFFSHIQIRLHTRGHSMKTTRSEKYIAHYVNVLNLDFYFFLRSVIFARVQIK